MKKELKQTIVNFIFENEKEFQLSIAVIGEFREYIYTGKGEYLIGGEDVAKFIKDAINLLTNKNY